MLQSLNALLAPALAQRLTLLINHVLGSESIATQRLQPHAGRTLRLTLADWPALLPMPPALAWRVTPAGLLDWVGADAPADPELVLRIDASNPALLAARTVAGEPAAVQIEGDAQFAGDVNWLIHNLRWDVEADLERFFGPFAARQLGQLGRALAGGLRIAVKGAVGLAERIRPGRGASS